MIKAYRVKAWFYQRHGEQERDATGVYQYKWSTCKRSHKSYSSWKVSPIQGVSEDYKLRGSVKV
jgi:hypothetical protein